MISSHVKICKINEQMKYLCPDLPANLNIHISATCLLFISGPLSCHVQPVANLSKLSQSLPLSHGETIDINNKWQWNQQRNCRKCHHTISYINVFYLLPIEPSLNFMNWPQKVVSSHLKYYQTTIARPSYSSYSSYSRYKSHL